MIRFRYQSTVEDWTTFNRIVVFRQFRYLFGLAFVLFFFFITSPFIQTASGHGGDSLLRAYGRSTALLFIPGLAVFLLIAADLGARKRWKTAEILREAKDYEIDEKGVQVNATSLSGFLEWRHFTQGQFTRGYFILKTAQNQFYYFPASVVSDQAALMTLLEKKIPMKKG